MRGRGLIYARLVNYMPMDKFGLASSGTCITRLYHRYSRGVQSASSTIYGHAKIFIAFVS